MLKASKAPHHADAEGKHSVQLWDVGGCEDEAGRHHS